MVGGRGRTYAVWVEFARFVPKTLKTIPGAYTCANDAPLATPPILVVVEAPIVNATGTFTNCGVVFADWKTSVVV
jgi:hypothetical protein